MFYVKSNINEECTITTEITDENVFTTCPVCGVEHMIDIVEILGGGDVDLFSSAVYCTKCTAEYRKKNNPPQGRCVVPVK